ncbi:S8/S53 family peptidase (macronuclear) [Tetrahymena thermophila SB210]|uniref:subtilisin n=1 Tax=Tetrahymena thermophila (strain SB210) TaxID=312017 RepID=Q229U5_TETTS|nr:S8/S53 family peptidase [Tetrahymena thermophila SB210]EAR82056.2 S8/S53 family peptidase [Tetrahymena thermophila SB210]|eukprot:XP_001029719.2 S8/S53 family peptidase [Tetrahymena thermophila SB210]
MMSQINNKYILLLILFIKYSVSCNTNRYKQVAVLDTYLSQHFKNIHQLNVQICQMEIEIQNEIINEDYQNYTFDNYSNHGEQVVKEILNMNPEVYILYFEISLKSKQNKIKNELLLKSLNIIEATLYQNPKSIEFINLSIGSNQKNIWIQQSIENILSINHNIIIASAAGNSGPLRGSIQFPSQMQSILSIGTMSLLSSRGPSFEMLNYPIKKPDFIINLSDENINNSSYGTSIACAQFTGFVSKYSYNYSQKNLFLIALIKSSYSYDSYSIYEQGFGILDLKQTVTVSRFSSFVEVFPSLIDLTNSYSYFDFVKQLDFQNQDLNVESFKLTLQIFNVFQKNILIQNIKLKNDSNFDSICPFSILAFDHYLDFKKSQIYFRFDLFQSQNVNSNDSQIVTCTLILDFQVKESFTNKIIVQSEIVKIKIEGKILLKRDVTYNILFNQYYQNPQLQNLEYKSNFYQYYLKNQYDFFGKSLLSNYFALKSHIQYLNQENQFQLFNLLETYTQFQDLNLLSNTLLVLVDFEIPLSNLDIEYIQNHILDRNNSLMIFGEWFSEINENEKAFDYQSINKLLRIFGVSFQQGSFSQKICDYHQQCFVYYSGCQIVIFENSNIVQNITYKKQVFKNDFEVDQDQEIIYYVEIKTKYNSNVFLFGDSACLEEAFQYQNCFYLIDKIIQQSQEIE